MPPRGYQPVCGAGPMLGLDLRGVGAGLSNGSLPTLPDEGSTDRQPDRPGRHAASVQGTSLAPWLRSLATWWRPTTDSIQLTFPSSWSTGIVVRLSVVAAGP